MGLILLAGFFINSLAGVQRLASVLSVDGRWRSQVGAGRTVLNEPLHGLSHSLVWVICMLLLSLIALEHYC